MKTAIVYVSTHHGNTKKLAEAIASARQDVVLIDGAKEPAPDLTGYDCIGLASGIAYGRFYPQMLKLMEERLPEGKKVFFLYTCGSMQPAYTRAAAGIAGKKNCGILGEYGCLGYDTYGPFRLVGGIAKGHPNDAEIAQAVRFFADSVG